MSTLLDRLPACVAVVLTLTLGAPYDTGPAYASNVSSLSGKTVKQACKAQAQKEDMGVGDFGDVEFDASRGLWTTKLMVQGKGDKFKARCEWDGSRPPYLTVAKTGDNIAAGQFRKKDVTIACKQQALLQGFGVGDFGDTNWDRHHQWWVSKMMISENGSKRKAACTWNGHDDPVIH